jgi:hypothetical protein
MHPNRAGRTGLLAALCAALASTAALAGATVRDETTLLVRTTAGAVERLVYEGELADGERRALSTAAGNPATLSRSGAGLLLELAGERFEVVLPEVEVGDAGVAVDDAAAGPRRIVIHRHEDQTAATGDAATTTTETRKVVKIVRHGETGNGDAAQAEALALAEAGGDPELLLLEGSGPKVLVMRRIVREDGTP